VSAGMLPLVRGGREAGSCLAPWCGVWLGVYLWTLVGHVFVCVRCVEKMRSWRKGEAVNQARSRQNKHGLSGQRSVLYLPGRSPASSSYVSILGPPSMQEVRAYTGHHRLPGWVRGSETTSRHDRPGYWTMVALLANTAPNTPSRQYIT
jgi:hypothetical protein